MNKQNAFYKVHCLYTNLYKIFFMQSNVTVEDNPFKSYIASSDPGLVLNEPFRFPDFLNVFRSPMQLT